MAPANAASDQVCMTNPLISNPLFHECCSPSERECLFSTLYPYFVRLPTLTFSSSLFLPQPLELGYMNAVQQDSSRHAVGHACLSWMPFNGRRKEQQTVLLWATQPSLAMDISVFMSPEVLSSAIRNVHGYTANNKVYLFAITPLWQNPY